MENAHGDFAAAVKLAPKQADARFLLAVADYKQSNYAVAADELRAAIGDGVVDSDLHYLLAECLLKLDAAKTADAMTKLDRAIASWSESVSARTLRASCCWKSSSRRRRLRIWSWRIGPIRARGALGIIWRGLILRWGGPMRPRGYTKSLIRRVAMR